MNYEVGNEDSDYELEEFRHSEVGDQCNNLIGNSLSKNVDSDIGSPLGKSHGCDVGTSDTEGWQEQKREEGVFRFAQDSTESLVSFNSEIKSDDGSWILANKHDANLKLQLQILDMAGVNEELKAKTRKVEKELSDNEKAFKNQLDVVNLKHAESMKAQQEVLNAERITALKVRQGFIPEYDYLTGKYEVACTQIEHQTRKIIDLEAKLSEYAEVLNQVKAPDGSIYTHKQRQDVVEGLKRDAVELKEFYNNQVKTLEQQAEKNSARLDEGAEELRNLQLKIQTLNTALSDEKQRFKELAAMLELERKSHMDTEETSLRGFQARVRDILDTAEHRDRQIQRMDNIIRSLQAHLIAAQQSYAAAVGSAENFRRAHEKSSEDNRGLVRQHHHDMEVMTVAHQATCDIFAGSEAALREVIATLTKRLGLMGDNCSCGKWKDIAIAMKQEILNIREDPRTSNDVLTSIKKEIDSQLPDRTRKEEVGNRKPGFDALVGAVASVDKKRLDKGKGIADDIAEKRSLEVAKNPSEIQDSELSKLQDAFRREMAKAEIDQDRKKAIPLDIHSDHPTQPFFWPKTISRLSGKATQPSEPKLTPVVVHSDKPIQPSNPKPASAPAHPEQPTQPLMLKPALAITHSAKTTQPLMPKPALATAHSAKTTQPLMPKPALATAHSAKTTQPLMPKPALATAHSEKSTQPPNPRPASAPVDSVRQPPKPSTISKIPAPAKVKFEDQSKETPRAAAQLVFSREFSTYEPTLRIRPYDAPVKKTRPSPGEKCGGREELPDPDAGF